MAAVYGFQVMRMVNYPYPFHKWKNTLATCAVNLNWKIHTFETRVKERDPARFHVGEFFTCQVKLPLHKMVGTNGYKFTFLPISEHMLTHDFHEKIDTKLSLHLKILNSSYHALPCSWLRSTSESSS